MRIVKYKKLKDNRYIVYLDNDLEITLYDDIIIKYNLLVNKELDDKLLKTITNDNDELVSYYLALKYITKRLRTEKEVREYLLKKDYSLQLINKNIDLLKKNKLLDDLIVLKAYINDQLNMTLKGPYKIEKELKSLGLTSESINEYLDYDNELFNAHAEKIISNRVKNNHKLSCNALKVKIKDDLFNMGYDVLKYEDMINIDFDDNNYLKHDYEIIAKKYLKKTNGNYIVKQKLLLKGYTIEQINSIMS